MKWPKGARQGVALLQGRQFGTALTHLSFPTAVLVDNHGTVYVVEQGSNQRVIRWQKGETSLELIVGGNGRGSEANQFSSPEGFSFDSHGHLFVTDWGNNRVQRFSIA